MQCCDVYDCTLQIVLRHRAAHHVRLDAGAGGNGCGCSSRFPKASFRIRTRIRSTPSPKPRRALHTSRWWSIRRPSPTCSAVDKDVVALMSTVGGASASTLGGPNYGEIVVHLKPRDERNRAGEPDHRGTAAEARRVFRACACTCRIRPPIRIGGQVTKSLYQFSMQSPDKKELYAAAQRNCRTKSNSCRKSRTSPAISRSSARR